MSDGAAGRPPLSPSSRVAVIAGEGRLPLDLARDLAAGGHPPFVALFGRPEATAAGLRSFEHQEMRLEDALSVVPLLKRRGITHAVLAGAIRRRPRWSALKPRRKLFGLALTALRGLRRGDDGLLRVVVKLFEDGGITVLGAQDILPDLLASAGPMTALRPSARDREDLEAALAAARAIGALDIGQAAVSVGGRVIALEGIEGTDGLLERVKALRGHGRIEGIAGGALVKCAKPGQELRADLPAIGADTVRGAAEAGLAGIGVEAGRSLILNRKQTTQEAERLGIFLVGLD